MKNLNRREILARFGIGAVIIPVVGAAPLGAAKLIEQPVLEPIKADETQIDALNVDQLYDVMRSSGVDVTDLREKALGGFYTNEKLRIRLGIYRADPHTSPTTFFKAAAFQLNGVKPQ